MKNNYSYYTKTRCVVCRKQTHGSLFCSLKHYSKYEKKKSKYDTKEAIKIIKENQKFELERLKEEKKFAVNVGKNGKRKKVSSSASDEQYYLDKNYLDGWPVV